MVCQGPLKVSGLLELGTRIVPVEFEVPLVPNGPQLSSVCALL